jgi:hypothetical protein
MLATTQQAVGAHLAAPLALFTVLADLARCDATHNLGQRQAAAIAPLAHAAQQGAQHAALICQTFLIVLGGQPATEAALQVRLPVGQHHHARILSARILSAWGCVLRECYSTVTS